MTKSELVDAVFEAAALPDITKKTTGEIVDAVFEALKDTVVEHGRFSYPGFGTFSVKKRQGRTGRNPRTGDAIEIPESRTVGFKPAPGLKEAL